VTAPEVIKRGVKKVVITHSPEQVDHTIVFGANEETYRPQEHHVISSSICDAVAVAPVLKVIQKEFGLDSGFLTTLHPWLAYQNLLDGPSISWAAPGTIYGHYAMGRASTGSLIPKPTSAVDATVKVLPAIRGKLQCMSFRIPVQTVGAANLYLNLERQATVDDVHAAFEHREAAQKVPVLHNNREPLVSVDFAETNYSAVIDQRWTAITGGRHLYLVLWYDNEWGYSSRVVDLVQFLGEAGWPQRQKNSEVASA
jgi:glyceraldehyde 3-phosphate dehydrogenase